MTTVWRLQFMTRVRGALLAAGLLLPAMGCTDSAPAESAFTAIDSAGIRVVTSVSPAWGSGPAPWTLAAAPSTSIGATEGAAPYLLSQVRGAARLPDGRIIVLNGGDGQLRFYGADGRFLESRAGLGQGPGELERPSGLVRLTDGSLLVRELVGWKQSRFDAEGRFVSSARLDNSRMNEFVDSIWGCPVDPGPLADGSYLGCAGSGVPRPQVPGFDRVSHWYFRTDLDASGVDTVGVAYGFNPNVLLGSFGAPVASGGTPLEVWVGDPATFQLTRWVEGRGIDMIVRVPGGLREVGSADRDRYGELFPTWTERSGVEFAATFPAFAHLQRDSLGCLWATKYEAPWEESGGSWVFAPSGELLGELSLPSGFRPLEIGNNYVLGVVADDLGVERIQVFGLERGTPDEASIPGR